MGFLLIPSLRAHLTYPRAPAARIKHHSSQTAFAQHTNAITHTTAIWNLLVHASKGMMMTDGQKTSCTKVQRDPAGFQQNPDVMTKSPI